MTTNKCAMPLIAMLALVAGCGGARAASQQPSVDFTNAMLAEVRNAEGQVLLSGRFVAREGENEIERKAALAPTGIDADATGEAEVEYCRDRDCDTQEVEFTVTNVQPGLALTFTIDGREFATVSADKDGRAEVERDVPLPGGR